MHSNRFGAKFVYHLNETYSTKFSNIAANVSQTNPPVYGYLFINRIANSFFPNPDIAVKCVRQLRPGSITEMSRADDKPRNLELRSSDHEIIRDTQ